MDWSNKKEVIEKVKRSAVALKKASLFQDDEEVVEVAVKSCGMAIEFASERVRIERPDLVKIALSSHGRAILHLPEYINDIEMIVVAYENDESISKYYKDNPIILRQLQLYNYQKKFER